MSSLLILINSAPFYKLRHGFICTSEEFIQLPEEIMNDAIVIQGHLKNQKNGEGKIQNLLDYFNGIHDHGCKYLLLITWQISKIEEIIY